MDITNNSLRYFNQEGLELIAESIETEFERLLDEDDFEDQEDFKEELEVYYEKLTNAEPHDLFNALSQTIHWLNSSDNMDSFGTEGWEYACGLEYF